MLESTMVRKNNIKLARLHYVDDICYVFKIKNQTDIKNGQLI